MRGVNELFNDKTSLLIKGFNLCLLPEGYTPEEKPSKLAPENYTNVFPEPAIFLLSTKDLKNAL